MRRCPNRNKREKEKVSRNIDKTSKSSVVSQLSVQSSQVVKSPGDMEQDSLSMRSEADNSLTNNQSVNDTGVNDHIEEDIEGGPEENSIGINEDRNKVVNKKKMFSCSKCDKKFYKKQYAKNHCKDKTPWICPNCFGEIDHVQNIKRHMKSCIIQQPTIPTTSVPTDFKCELCNKSFNNNFNLRRHKLKMHKVMENNAIVCDEKTCPFTTKNRAQLKRHKTMNHTKLVISECAQCGQKFLSKSGLQKHIRSDHRFSCKNCPQTFSMEKQLRQHNRVVHNTVQEEVGSSDQAAVVVSRVIGEHATHKVYTGTQPGNTD